MEALELAEFTDHGQHPEYHASRYLWKKLQTFREKRLMLLEKEDGADLTPSQIIQKIKFLGSCCVQSTSHLVVPKCREWLQEHRLRQIASNRGIHGKLSQ